MRRGKGQAQVHGWPFRDENAHRHHAAAGVLLRTLLLPQVLSAWRSNRSGCRRPLAVQIKLGAPPGTADGDWHWPGLAVSRRRQRRPRIDQPARERAPTLEVDPVVAPPENAVGH